MNLSRTDICYECKQQPDNFLTLQCGHDLCLQCSSIQFHNQLQKTKIFICKICGRGTQLDHSSIYELEKLIISQQQEEMTQRHFENKRNKLTKISQNKDQSQIQYMGIPPLSLSSEKKDTNKKHTIDLSFIEDRNLINQNNDSSEKQFIHQKPQINGGLINQNNDSSEKQFNHQKQQINVNTKNNNISASSLISRDRNMNPRNHSQTYQRGDNEENQISMRNKNKILVPNEDIILSLRNNQDRPLNNNFEAPIFQNKEGNQNNFAMKTGMNFSHGGYQFVVKNEQKDSSRSCLSTLIPQANGVITNSIPQYFGRNYEKSNQESDDQLNSPQEELKTRLKITDYSRICKEHDDEEVNYFCFDCKSSCVCSECVIHGSHRDHQVKTVKKSFPIIKQILEELQKEIENGASIIADKKESVFQQKNEVLSIQKNLKLEISATFNVLKQKVEDTYLELIGQTEEMTKKTIHDLEESLKQVDRHVYNQKQFMNTISEKLRCKEEILNFYGENAQILDDKLQFKAQSHISTHFETAKQIFQNYVISKNKCLNVKTRIDDLVDKLNNLEKKFHTELGATAEISVLLEKDKNDSGSQKDNNPFLRELINVPNKQRSVSSTHNTKLDFTDSKYPPLTSISQLRSTQEKLTLSKQLDDDFERMKETLQRSNLQKPYSINKMISNHPATNMTNQCIQHIYQDQNKDLEGEAPWNKRLLFKNE